MLEQVKTLSRLKKVEPSHFHLKRNVKKVILVFDGHFANDENVGQEVYVGHDLKKMQKRLTF